MLQEILEAPVLSQPIVRASSSLGATRLLRPDKIASVAGRAALGDTVPVCLMTLKPKVGDLIAVRALSDNPKYNRLELTTGRMAHVNPQDVLIGVVGARRALKGYVGEVPDELAVGDELHLLNMGGVLGRCTGYHHEVGPAIRVAYMGAVVRDDKVLNMSDFGMPMMDRIPGHIPVVAVAGSCMHAGKTRAASELVKRFAAAGYRVAAGKLSGVGCLKDSLEMRDNGAAKTLCFVDLGLPSTVGIPDLGKVARSIIAHLAASAPDVIVVELGDGILGGYNVAQIFDDPAVRRCLAATLFCANDFVSAWGGIELLGRQGISPDAISGPVTDSKMGIDYIRQNFGLAAANAMVGGAALFDIVESRIKSWEEA